MKKVRRWYWSYFFKPRNRNESNSQVMAKVTETSLMYMTGSDSCQIKSCQHKTICGEEGDMLWPTTIQMYNTGKLRFLSNGVSWEDALRVTKSGSYPSRGGGCDCGKPWKTMMWWYFLAKSTNQTPRATNVECLPFGRAYHTCSCKKSLIISLSEETATARCLVSISRAIAVMFNAT